VDIHFVAIPGVMGKPWSCDLQQISNMWIDHPKLVGLKQQSWVDFTSAYGRDVFVKLETQLQKILPFELDK